MATVKEENFQLNAINPEDTKDLKNRDPKYLERDLAFIATLSQAAINVELFTIPLYMTSMYSIVGMHQINTKDTEFYKGRWWPGSAPSATPDLSTVKNKSISNQKAFNNIFSVFMEEMLHLQLASNVAAKLGLKPSFTSSALQNQKNAWICYGGNEDSKKTIPHIIDFRDCKEDSALINVELGALNENQINLFIAIEETLQNAQGRIKPECWEKYSHQAPYNDWKTTDNESDLPLFGSIGKMYETLWAYIEIEYTDGTTLLSKLLKNQEPAFQRDQFNVKTDSHPQSEFPHITTTLGQYSSELILKVELINIINAITDQGEGKGVVHNILKTWDTENFLANHISAEKSNFSQANANMPSMVKSVRPKFQPDTEALKADYVGYDDKGSQTKISGQAKARIDAAKMDHLETFILVKEIMKKDDFLTWDKWHAQGHKWSADMLETKGDSNDTTTYNIPSAQEVADALNEVKSKSDTMDYYDTLSKAAVGTLKGITTSLDSYWNQECAEFPNPAMVGSGDRISICWAIMGKKPDLLLGIDIADNNKEMFNACQGMSLMNGQEGKDEMPDVRIYHSCKGSNECKTQGGCGFVHSSTSGGGQCGGSTNIDQSTIMSAPANNKCGAKGGCAVPISASQLFPNQGSTANYKMQVYTYQGEADFKTTEVEEITYKVGEAVYDVAWNAYTKALESRGLRKEKLPKKPKADPLRVAFPPST